MTQQVRTSYRKHRKAAWGLALLVVAAIATVTIPLASGAPSKTLRFTTQPATPLESSTSQSTSVSVAVFSGGPNPVNSSPPPTPSLSAISAAGVDLSAYFTGINAPSYSGGYWTWNVAPTSSAPSGVYTLRATLGTLAPATSDPFRVVQFICPPSCDGTSNLGSSNLAPGKLKIANTLNSSVLLDFQAGLNPVPPGCNNDPFNPNDGAPHTWNRLFIDANGDGTPEAYFPAVALDFNSENAKMLQVTYMVRNSDWVLTNAARGNNDIELCAVAKHQDPTRNTGLAADKFAGKYGPSTWDSTTHMYSGVLTTVSNPSKVKTDGTGSPAICGRGNFVDLSGVTWRAWTVCIPVDWDWGMG
jgi:hypothetical protein